MAELSGKSILMLIAFRDFRDEEYFLTREVLESAGAKISVASAKKGIAIGADGNEAGVDLLAKDAKAGDYDAIVFVGGSGALTYLDNDDSYKLAQEAVSLNKVLAAICISPVILARAGVLKGKKATVWTGPMDDSPAEILRECGAEFNPGPAVRDGLIVTGNGPSAAKEFAMKIIEVLVR